MIIACATDLKKHFKDYAEKIIDGEWVIVPRSENKNIVLISEAEYNSLLKIKEESLNKKN